MLYDLTVELNINVNKGHVEGITIKGKRPSEGIDDLIAEEEDRIMQAIQEELYDDEQEMKIRKEESWHEYLDRMRNGEE